MTNQEIKELLQIFNESDVAEMEVQRGTNRLRLRRAVAAQEHVVPAAAPQPAAASANHPVPALAARADANQILVKSPIVRSRAG